VKGRELKFLLCADGYHAADLVGLEADLHRPAHTRQDGDVVQLLDHALDPQPTHSVPGAQIDDHQPQRGSASRYQLVVQPQSREPAVLARLGEADHREPPVEGETAAITWAEGRPLEPTAL
jgi:hypothetical protein